MLAFLWLLHGKDDIIETYLGWIIQMRWANIYLYFCSYVLFNEYFIYLVYVKTCMYVIVLISHHHLRILIFQQERWEPSKEDKEKNMGRSHCHSLIWCPNRKCYLNLCKSNQIKELTWYEWETAHSPSKQYPVSDDESHQLFQKNTRKTEYRRKIIPEKFHPKLLQLQICLTFWSISWTLITMVTFNLYE